MSVRPTARPEPFRAWTKSAYVEASPLRAPPPDRGSAPTNGRRRFPLTPVGAVRAVQSTSSHQVAVHRAPGREIGSSDVRIVGYSANRARTIPAPGRTAPPHWQV